MSGGGRPARSAGAELLVVQKWEGFAAWLLGHTERWPKSKRFTLARRMQDHALDVMDALVVARYEPTRRPALLHDVNLRLERMRFLARLAHADRASSKRGFESTMRGLDEIGRMVWGWRQSLRAVRRPAGSEEDTR